MMLMKVTSQIGRGFLNRGWALRRLATAAQRATASDALPTVDLYQYEVCPFCAKVKAVMDFHQIPYTTIEVNPLSKKELTFSKDYRKVPIAFIDGEKLVESDSIMDKLRALRIKDVPSDNEIKWRDWANKKLVVTLPSNLYRTLPEAWDSFKYISQNNKFSAFESIYVRSVGSVFMRALKGRMMKKHGLTDERKDLAALLETWMKDAVGDKKFQLGNDQPGLADLAVFGMIRSMTGVPTFAFVMENSDFRDWYSRVESAVGASARLAAN